MKEIQNFEPESLIGQRIKNAAEEAERNFASFKGQAAEFIKFFPKLGDKAMRREAGGLLKGYLFEYRKAAKSKNEKEINIELPIDSKIPFEPKVFFSYASHIGLVVHGVNFAKKEFGKEAEADVLKFSNDLVALFPEASKVFNKTQTSLHRPKGGGLAIKTLRVLDNEKNACPSLHAEIVALAYSRITDIIDAHAKDKEEYEPMKEFYFKQAVRILESVLLIKQHAVMDIGVGLGVLSGLDKTFSRERAEKMVNAMFEKENYGMDKAVVNEIREIILSIYNEVTEKITENLKTPISEVIIEYLKDFGAKRSQEI
jgi:hypothetical protein